MAFFASNEEPIIVDIDLPFDNQLNNYKRVALVSHRIPQLALDVIVSKLSWKDAIEKDWRLWGNWKLGWHYNYDALLDLLFMKMTSG